MSIINPASRTARLQPRLARRCAALFVGAWVLTVACPRTALCRTVPEQPPTETTCWNSYIGALEFCIKHFPAGDGREACYRGAQAKLEWCLNRIPGHAGPDHNEQGRDPADFNGDGMVNVMDPASLVQGFTGDVPLLVLKLRAWVVRTAP